MRVSTLALVACVLAVAPATARAQQSLLPATPVVLPPPPGALTEAESKQLDAWLSSMRKWQRFETRWHNEAAHDPFGRILPRRHEPDPPEWLDVRCVGLGTLVQTLEGRLGEACRVLAGERTDASAEAIRTSTQATRADRERLVKNSFLTRVHIDGLWTTTSTDTRLYGLFGSHISLVDVGRVQFFGPPGILVLSVPDGRGSRELKMGYTWGMSVRLTDVKLFSPTKNLTLFLTMSKVWITGSAYDALNTGGFDIAGFSLAPRRASDR